MLKKYKKDFTVLVVAFWCISLIGCKKYLTHDNPSGVTDEEWWNTETDITNALSNVYAGIPGGTRGRQVMFWSGLSDEAVTRGDFLGQYNSFVRGVHDSRWGVALQIWRDDYIDIRRANRFIENYSKGFMDSRLKERMYWEAKALRAYYHMELLQFFGAIPLVTESVKPDENNLPRDSVEKVYDFILSELQDAAENLPEKYDDIDRWRMTSGICYALISRIALFFHDYEIARDAAKAIIDSQVYELYESPDLNANSYQELFSYTGELNNERIFFSNNGCSNAWTTFAPFGIGGEVYVSPTADIVNTYETKQGFTLQELGSDSIEIYKKDPNYKDNRDPRLKYSIYYPGSDFQGSYTLDPFNNPSDRIGTSKSTASGYWIRKYVDPKDRQTKSGSLDFMIIRYAEILLNYVEALVELGDWQNPDIIQYLNEIRNRAGMPNVVQSRYNNQSKVRELVKRERQVELSFEGQRYFDIRRWDIVNEVMNGLTYGATNPVTGEAFEIETRHYDPKKDFLWPIPLEEMNSNLNIKENNPGY